MDVKGKGIITRLTGDLLRFLRSLQIEQDDSSSRSLSPGIIVLASRVSGRLLDTRTLNPSNSC